MSSMLQFLFTVHPGPPPSSPTNSSASHRVARGGRDARTRLRWSLLQLHDEANNGQISQKIQNLKLEISSFSDVKLLRRHESTVVAVG
ncbi:hypothetical protein DY000_02030116 [Brassica cretica]|uniref:Uncharacterized protein n=1 Tax=Brassica cretica TaxID=69181 RepID=A0ABQ7DVW8_BRACR|nr:hypothetical protein DY000_02030116 [Brassica cretica]